MLIISASTKQMNEWRTVCSEVSSELVPLESTVWVGDFCWAFLRFCSSILSFASRAWMWGPRNPKHWKQSVLNILIQHLQLLTIRKPELLRSPLLDQMCFLWRWTSDLVQWQRSPCKGARLMEVMETLRRILMLVASWTEDLLAAVVLTVVLNTKASC